MREITCPSGLKVKVRGLKGKELKVFRERLTFMDKLLEACVTDVVDAGPYKVNAKGFPNWDDVLTGDRFFCLLAIRIETYGVDYDLDTRCPNCKTATPRVTKLDALPIKALAPEDAEAFRSNMPLVAIVPNDGREVKFRLTTGKDERAAGKSNKGAEDSLTKMMALRILELDGDADRVKIQEFVEECPLGDLMKLLKEFDKRDCGVDTTISIECPDPDCLTTTEITLPLGKAFLLPS